MIVVGTTRRIAGVLVARQKVSFKLTQLALVYIYNNINVHMYRCKCILKFLVSKYIFVRRYYYDCMYF